MINCNCLVKSSGVIKDKHYTFYYFKVLGNNFNYN